MTNSYIKFEYLSTSNKNNERTKDTYISIHTRCNSRIDKLVYGKTKQHTQDTHIYIYIHPYTLQRTYRETSIRKN